ncbi:MAG: tRNA (adenosine(37)-N6)-threonylcarbamoyltransferase complex dimerization subunit type 1 TsaB [Microbacterium sp.]
MILAVDTSLGTTVALIDADGAVRTEASTVDPLGHAEVIGELLASVLGGAGEGEITQVVSGMGPGPFTGLRIGIAAARTFALGRGIGLIPVPSHFAAAWTHADDGRIAIVTDARRREVAVTVFDGLDADGIPAVVSPTVLVPAAEADAHLGGIPRIDVTVLSGADLARVGARALAAGRTLTDDAPLYLRHPDVVVPGAPKRVGS